jgi:Sulfatase-modifying factor enzyme 1/Putative metal-binding motif
VAEQCDGLDNDCDGNVDDGNPEGGTPCGIDTGECTLGAEVCQGGTLVCQGGVAPVAELCDGLDNDCDGTADDGSPQSGGLCGSDVGQCEPGVRVCTSGSLVCTGQTGPSTETCNGLDDDCDGVVDDGNPDGGEDCGNDTGECSFGQLTCQGGTLVCTGGTGPAVDVCDTLDNDCDGDSDEDFVLASDVNHCGDCVTVCNPDHATPACVSGDCEVLACDPGFFDDDGDPANGCEYACDFAGTEICNGEDDDCDDVIDETLTVPANFCNANGVCAGTLASCGGVAGWECNYPATHEADELLCDTLDNDCDGETDEGYVLLGTQCSNGTGTCKSLGEYECNSTHDDVVCNAGAAGTPDDEACDNQDNDCDGNVDERVADDPMTAWRDGVDYTAIDRVLVQRSGGGFMEIMSYEASRPDASDTDAGTAGGFACSNPGVLPWTNVSWTEANAACCGLNAGGACPGPTDTGMWRLCDAPDWERACRGPSGTCEHSYTTDCTSSQPLACNGNEYDCKPSQAFDQDCLMTTGDAAFPMCGTSWDSAGTVYDLSGNAKEWTATAQGTGIHEIRGGAYTNIEAGRSCDFDFVVAADAFAHVNTGFRCCYY